MLEGWFSHASLLAGRIFTVVRNQRFKKKKKTVSQADLERVEILTNRSEQHVLKYVRQLRCAAAMAGNYIKFQSVD